MLGVLDLVFQRVGTSVLQQPLDPEVYQPERLVPDLVGESEKTNIVWSPLQIQALNRREMCKRVRLEEVIDGPRDLGLPGTRRLIRLRRCQ